MRSNFFIVIICMVGLVAACDSQKDTPESRIDQGKQPDELEKLSNAIRENPNDGQAYYERALYWQNRKQFDKAEQDLRKALTADSTVSEFHRALGNIQYLKGEVSKGQESFNKAVELDPENTEALVGLAEINLMLRKYQKSLDLVNRALEVDERIHKGYFLKGFVYKETGDTTRAISSFQTAVEVKPDFYDGYIMLGMMHQRKGDSLALEYYKTASELKPQNSEPKINMALFHQDHGNPDRALKLYRELLEQDSTNALALFNSGYVHLVELNNYDSAHYYFDRAAQNQNEYFEAIYNRGYASELMGEEQKAIEDYRKTLDINPQYNKAAEGLNRLVGNNPG
jgi:tetratricopeptide (TPR) repeat protein